MSNVIFHCYVHHYDIIFTIDGEILIMGMLSVTIFAFLIARSASPAHNKIFGAKFLSFERAAIVC